MACIPKKKFQFDSVKLLKESCLGTGSYGSVYKAECNGLMCAAKLIHPTLFTPDTQEVDTRRAHRLPMKRFEQECELLSSIQHPNIIQYLGMFQDPDTGIPVLLMELMDKSLTQFLEKPQAPPLPLHTQVNICHDISLALSFLHSNGIIHRDLSSNNILLVGDRRAKVTDFGMAKFTEFDSKETSTLCPGTQVYMPPEAIGDVPRSSEKTNCFSFGVLCIQVITRLYPAPSKQYKEVRGLFWKHYELQTELKRRQNHLTLIPHRHPLLKTIQECLKDKDTQRPTSKGVSDTLHSIKQTPEYSQSQEKVSLPRSIKPHTNAKNSQLVSSIGQVEHFFRDEGEYLEITMSCGSAPEKSDRVAPAARKHESKIPRQRQLEHSLKYSELSPEEKLEAEGLKMDLDAIDMMFEDYKALVSDMGDEIDDIHMNDTDPKAIVQPLKESAELEKDRGDVVNLTELSSRAKRMNKELRQYLKK
jgi:serine/threonine protein kinase